MHTLASNDRQVDPPVLRGLLALQEASRNPRMPLFRRTLLSTYSIDLETAFALAARGDADDLYVVVHPDA